MYKIAVIGDYDSIYGFAALGLDTFPVTAQEEAGERLQELAAGGYGNTGAGVEGVKKTVEQAVGSDILFGNE